MECKKTIVISKEEMEIAVMDQGMVQEMVRATETEMEAGMVKTAKEMKEMVKEATEKERMEGTVRREILIV